jgi:hypothetical protein
LDECRRTRRLIRAAARPAPRQDDPSAQLKRRKFRSDIAQA